MRRVAGRMQTVGAGMLVLAVTVAAPALSAAQQGATDPNVAPTDPPLTTPAPPPEPAEDGKPEDGSAEQDGGSAAEQVVSEAPAQDRHDQRRRHGHLAERRCRLPLRHRRRRQLRHRRLQRRPEPLRDLQQRRHDLVLLHRSRPGPVGQGRGPLIGRWRWQWRRLRRLVLGHQRDRRGRLLGRSRLQQQPAGDGLRRDHPCGDRHDAGGKRLLSEAVGAAGPSAAPGAVLLSLAPGAALRSWGSSRARSSRRLGRIGFTDPLCGERPGQKAPRRRDGRDQAEHR